MVTQTLPIKVELLIEVFPVIEMFEVGPRSAGMAWGSLANWCGNFLVGMTFPALRDAVGAYSFLLFAAVTAALFVLQKLYFPETRGRSALQLAQLCGRGFRSRPLAAACRVTSHTPRHPCRVTSHTPRHPCSREYNVAVQEAQN